MTATGPVSVIKCRKQQHSELELIFTIPSIFPRVRVAIMIIIGRCVFTVVNKMDRYDATLLYCFSLTKSHRLTFTFLPKHHNGVNVRKLFVCRSAYYMAGYTTKSG